MEKLLISTCRKLFYSRITLEQLFVMDWRIKKGRIYRNGIRRKGRPQVFILRMKASREEEFS